MQYDYFKEFNAKVDLANNDELPFMRLMQLHQSCLWVIFVYIKQELWIIYRLMNFVGRWANM